MPKKPTGLRRAIVSYAYATIASVSGAGSDAATAAATPPAAVTSFRIHSS